MANRGQFEAFEEGRAAECAVCEAMCPDAVDGALNEAEQRAFDRHVAGCATCARELAEARRGAAWLAMLKGHAPEPSAALLQRILMETTGAAESTGAAETTPLPNATGSRIAEARPAEARPFGELPAGLAAPASAPARGRFAAGGFAALWRRAVETFSLENASQAFHPRMAMTAAMAFFSIALTLNMTGVRLSDVAHGLMQPMSLRRTMADAGARAERSFQNLRVVYAVESRVSDLRSNDGFGDRSGFGDNGLGEDQAPGSLDRSGPLGSFGGSAVPAAAPAQQPPGSGDPDGTAAPGKKKPEPAAPHGSSELQFPIEPVAAWATTVRKGV